MGDKPEEVQHVKVVSMKGAIEDAEQLVKDRSDLTERVQANRELCRMLVKAGYADAAQKTAVEKLYPTKGAKPAPEAAKAA